MSSQYKVGDRANFGQKIAALSLIMATFIEDKSEDIQKKAISSVQGIENFLFWADKEKVVIDRDKLNYFGFDGALEYLQKQGDVLVVDPNELRKIYQEITDSFSQYDQWLALKFAVHNRLPSLDLDPELAAIVDPITAQNVKKFS